MNGVHDMGGMQGMGAIHYEKDEPVFHAVWESRVYAMTRAMRAWNKWNLDSWRFDIELLPPADYLRMSYYEKWLAVLEQQVARYGFVSQEEHATPALTVEAARRLDRGIPWSDDASRAPVFQVGEHVRARNMNPIGHTRLPRYARGKSGQIVRDHGVYTFPDTNSRFQGECRQHVYSVRFAARELWGDQASARDSVYLDLWDDYLERA